MEYERINIPEYPGLIFSRDQNDEACCSLDEKTNIRDVTVPPYVILDGVRYRVTDLILSNHSDNRFIRIPDTVSQIAAGDFTHLIEIDVSQDNEHYTSVGGVLFTKDMKELIKYPPLRYGSSYDVPDTVKKIGYGAFCGAKFLEKVRLPDGIKAVEEAAFENCPCLRSINLPDSIRLLDDFAFAGCRSLKRVHLPKNLRFIGESLFHECFSLRSIRIPEGVKVIRNCAFNYCVSLQSVVLPKSLKTIDWLAFGGCPLLKDLKIPKGVEVVDEDVD